MSPDEKYSDVFLLPSQWPLAAEESDYEHNLNMIRKANSNLIVIGKTTVGSDKEDYDNDADDDDANLAEESEGNYFEPETG